MERSGFAAPPSRSLKRIGNPSPIGFGSLGNPHQPKILAVDRHAPSTPTGFEAFSARAVVEAEPRQHIDSRSRRHSFEHGFDRSRIGIDVIESTLDKWWPGHQADQRS